MTHALWSLRNESSKPHAWVLYGRLPVRNEFREGAHHASWQYARLNSVPCAA